jgi:hypothetical protein
LVPCIWAGQALGMQAPPVWLPGCPRAYPCRCKSPHRAWLAENETGIHFSMAWLAQAARACVQHPGRCRRDDVENAKVTFPFRAIHGDTTQCRRRRRSASLFPIGHSALTPSPCSLLPLRVLQHRWVAAPSVSNSLSFSLLPPLYAPLHMRWFWSGGTAPLHVFNGFGIWSDESLLNKARQGWFDPRSIVLCRESPHDLLIVWLPSASVAVKENE